MSDSQNTLTIGLLLIFEKTLETLKKKSFAKLVYSKNNI